MGAGDNSLFVTSAFGPVTGVYSPANGAAFFDGGSGSSNNLPIGMCEGGKMLSRTLLSVPIAADEHGKETIDDVFAGADVFLSLTLKELRTGGRAMIWPFSNNFGQMPQPGVLMTDFAGVLVLTSITGTTRNRNEFTTRTFGKCVMSIGHNVAEMMATDQNNIPIVLKCYKYFVSGNYVHFVDAAGVG